MAAAARIRVDGIHQAFDRVTLGGGVRRSVLVQKMRVSEAGSALTIIGAAATEDPAWEVTNRTEVEKMAASAESLRLLLEVLLPKLRLRPTSPSRLNALRLHAAYLRNQAAEVSRSFLAAVVIATDRFSAYIEDAEALPPHNPHGHLLGQVDDLMAMVRRILDGTYTLRLPVGGAAPAGGVEAAAAGGMVVPN